MAQERQALGQDHEQQLARLNHELQQRHLAEKQRLYEHIDRKAEEERLTLIAEHQHGTETALETARRDWQLRLAADLERERQARQEVHARQLAALRHDLEQRLEQERLAAEQAFSFDLAQAMELLAQTLEEEHRRALAAAEKEIHERHQSVLDARRSAMFSEHEHAVSEVQDRAARQLQNDLRALAAPQPTPEATTPDSGQMTGSTVPVALQWPSELSEPLREAVELILRHGTVQQNDLERFAARMPSPRRFFRELERLRDELLVAGEPLIVREDREDGVFYRASMRAGAWGGQ